MEYAGIKIAEFINEAVDEAIQELHAEITQLRAELEQERELADRLAASCKSAQFESRKAYNLTENFHAVLDSVRKATTDALTAHATRRSK